MGATYTRQSSFTDGDVITADLFNNEYDQLLAAFASSSGHTHDGTAAEGGPITKLLGTSITIGDATSGTDITVTFDGESNDGVLKWMEDEDYFEFSDDLLIASTEKIQFRDTAIYIQSSADGQLDLVADTEIQIAATTIDINGLVDISGNLSVGGNLDVTGTIDFSDSNITNAGSIGLDSIFGDADSNTSITFSGSDVITVATGGSTAFTVNADQSVTFSGNVIIGSANIAEAELEILDGATVTTTELNIIDGDTSASATTVVDADRVVFNDAGTMKQVAVTDLAAYFDDEITAMPNLVTTAATTVGALNSGSITSGFGTIDTGSSAITTTGLISGGSLDIDDVLINGTTIGHTDDTDLITLANGVVTVAGEVSMTTLDIGGTNVTSTATELNLLDGVSGLVQADFTKLAAVDSTAAELNIVDGGTSATSTTVADADRVVMNDNGTMVQVAVTDLAAYFDDEITAMPNLVTTAATSVGALNSGSITSGFGTIDTGSSNITTTGVGSFGSLDISGDIDVDGTTNLDVVDIDGALTQDGGAVFNEASADVDFRVESNGNANMLFVDGGNNRVGVGTSSPSNLFHIKDSTADSIEMKITNTNADAVGANIHLEKDSASPADNDFCGEITFVGSNDNNQQPSFGSISVQMADVSDGSEDGVMLFKTNVAGTFAERMRISGGNVGIGTSSPSKRVHLHASNDSASLRLENTANDKVFDITPSKPGVANSGLSIHNVTDDRIDLHVDNSGNIIIGSSGGTLQTATAGTSNFRAGVNAGNSIQSGGNFNTVLGDEAGTAITTGDDNVAVGYAAGDAMTTGSYNAIVGKNSGGAITTGVENVSVGWNSLDALTEGGQNVALGASALGSDTLGSRSVAVGYQALTTQNFTTATDAHNTAVGYKAGEAVTTGANNTIIGANTGIALTSGSNNNLIGGLAGDALTTGHSNNIMGVSCGTALTDADYNVAIGQQALNSDTLGSQTVAIGSFALSAQNYTTATNSLNTAVGYAAGAAINGSAAGAGDQNTLIGGLTGDALTIGRRNAAIGVVALSADTAGSLSVAMGYGALNAQNFSTATDTYNTAIGPLAGAAVTTGKMNTFMGGNTGYFVTTGKVNTFIGTAVGPACTIGTHNTGVGGGEIGVSPGALDGVTEGDNNSALGHSAGSSITTGDNNLMLGHDAGVTGSPGGNITTASNEIGLGDENISAANIQVDWTVASDQRDKTDFTALDLGLDFVKALAPVTYKWDKRSKYGDKTADDYDLNAQTPDGTHKEDWLDIGFKAQEVQALEEAAGYTTAAKKNLTVSTSGDGKQMGLQYSKFVPILVKAIQEQNALIEALTARVATLEG